MQVVLPADVVKGPAYGYSRVPYSYPDVVSQESPRNDVQGPFCGEIQMDENHAGHARSDHQTALPRFTSTRLCPSSETSHQGRILHTVQKDVLLQHDTVCCASTVSRSSLTLDSSIRHLRRNIVAVLAGRWHRPTIVSQFPQRSFRELADWS